MVGRAVAYLSRLVAPAKIVAFRAGSWGMGPPSREILEALIAHGIRIDLSMIQGAFMDGEAIRLDYTQLECPYKAYPPDLDDIRKIGSTKCQLVALPTQTVPKTLKLKLLSKCLSLSRRVAEKCASFGTGKEPVAARQPSPAVRDSFGAESEKGRWDGRGRWDYILDFSSDHSSRFLNILVDACIDRARKVRDRSFQVLVFANHTKNLQKDYDFHRIEAAILHVRRKHPDITFLTISQVAARASELL